MGINTKYRFAIFNVTPSLFHSEEQNACYFYCINDYKYYLTIQFN